MREREAAVAKAKASKKGKERELLQEELLFESVEVLDNTIRAMQKLSLPERVKTSEIHK